jgi:hypothetical protein
MLRVRVGVNPFLDLEGYLSVSGALWMRFVLLVLLQLLMGVALNVDVVARCSLEHS